MQTFLARVTPLEIMRFIGVFAVMLAAAKLGQYLFFEWRTSPAILWPPTGIAFAIIWLWGYRYAVPILAGLLVASFTGPAAHLVPAVVTTPVAQVLGTLLGAYALQKYGFNGSFSRARNIVIFFGVAIASCMIAPTITTTISLLTGNLTTLPYVSWSRAWAGYLFSCLVFTPLIISWSRADYKSMRGRYIEPVAAALFLFASVYALFWDTIPSEFSFLSFVAFFVAHFWICLRFPTMMVTLSFFCTTVFGMIGLFLHPSPARPLNAQLFSAELFFFLVLPIFYTFYALVKERSYAVFELQAAMRRLERESLVKTDFIAVLAHELRNPLAPVKTTLEILGLQKLDPETKELIRSAHRQVHSMRRLLDDLLDISRVDQGKFELHKERTHLRTIIEQAINSTKSLFDRGHTYVIAPACEASIWLFVDPVRLEQALVNLLNNAAKYTPDGGRIEVNCVISGNTIELQVRDNGLGIAQEHIDTIFEPFWQERNGSSGAGGIGIGLSLTKHIIELHGGTVRAMSKGRGKGSVFSIILPYTALESQPQTENSLPPAGIPSERILIVDDNQAAADSLQKLLTIKGHTVTAAYLGGEAITRVQEFRPSLILLDIGLPDMTGYEVAAQLRLNGYKGTIIALSGYGQDEDRQKAKKAGCDDHFTKPMSIARLEAYLSAQT